MVVVLPPPLTPTTMTTAGGFSSAAPRLSIEEDVLSSCDFGWSAATTALLSEDFKSAGVLALPLRTSSRTPSTTRRAARGPKSDAWAF